MAVFALGIITTSRQIAYDSEKGYNSDLMHNLFFSQSKRKAVVMGIHAIFVKKMNVGDFDYLGFIPLNQKS